MSNYHLTDEDVYLQNQCQFCDSTFEEKDRSIKLQESPTIWMIECANCKLGTGESLPFEEAVTKLYDPAHYQATLTGNTAISNRLAKKIISAVSYENEKAYSILDFGGGNGVLCDEVRKLLMCTYPNITIEKAVVVDVFDSVSFDDIAFQSLTEFESNASKSYDIVIASAVLEHLTDAQPKLTKLLDIIKPAGVFYARTPYELPLAKLPLKYKTSWPVHLHDMGASFWEYIADIHSQEFTVIKSNTSTLETSFKTKPLYSLVALLLKLPSYLETSTIKKAFKYSGVLWPYIGGWEVIFKKKREH